MSSKGRGLTQSTISGLLWTAWGKGGNMFLTLLALAVLARLLSPNEFGTVSAALVVVGFSNIFSRLGLGPAVVQRESLQPRHLAAAFVGSCGLGLLVGMAIWLVAPLAAGFFRNPDVAPVLRTLAWLFPIHGLSTVAEALALRDLRFRWIANLELMAYAVGHVAVPILLAIAGFGVWALVAGALVGAVIKAAAYLWTYRPPLKSRPEWHAFKELLYFGGGFTLARIANQLALQGDNLVVGHSLGSAALGIYGRAYNLMAAPASAIGKVLDDVLFPTLARVQDDVERLARGFRRAVAVIALATLPASVAVVILAPELVRVVLGPQWLEVVGPFRILAAGLMFRTSYKMSDSLARSTGVVYRRARRQMVYAALVIGGAYVGQGWGLEGVAAGVLVAVVANFILMAQLSLELCQLSWRSMFEIHRPAIVLAGGVGLVSWACSTLLRDLGMPAAAVLLASGMSAVASLAWLMIRFPKWTLGPEGQWTVDALKPLVRKARLPSGPGGAQAIPVADSTTSG